jgi:hypothetical protein
MRAVSREVWAFVEIVRDCVALAPLQGASMMSDGDLGHRSAQPQAILLVPVGDARVPWRREQRSVEFPVHAFFNQRTGQLRHRSCAKTSGLLWLPGICAPRANGPGSYQPGPTAQVSGSSHPRRAEGPSHRSGMERPYRASGFVLPAILGRWPRLVWSAPLALRAVHLARLRERAERVGFEPTVPSRARRFSRPEP